MTQEQIERELSKLYLELNQRPLKDGLRIMTGIKQLEQLLRGLLMSNVLQFHSKKYKQCDTLVNAYDNLGNLLLKAEGEFFNSIEAEMEQIFFQLEDLIGEINHEKQRVSIHRRLLNINMNIYNELKTRKHYVN